MQGQTAHARERARRLIDELRAQILPDGGHISRNPGALVEMLLDLLPLRQAFAARNVPPPPALQQRHRPHDADAALLPPRRRQFRAVQRHGPDAERSGRDRARLRRRARRAGRERAAFRLSAVEAGETVLMVDTGRRRRSR